MNRRTFIKRSLLGVGAASLGVGLYTWQVEPYWLEFVHETMPIKQLPPDMIGKTIMQISDVHVSNRFDLNYLIDAFETAKTLEPDIVVYTGDYVSYEDHAQFEQLKHVFAHAPIGKLGTVGVLGNHDYGHGWAQQNVADTITELLEKAGIAILKNAQTTIAGLTIIGLDDYWGLNFDPLSILNDYNPNGANLVLCHNPDACDKDVWNGYQGWILSGHTHGGQCKPPFLPPPILPVKNERYTAGKIDLYDGRMIYINRALGHLIPVRFNVRPEITLFHLQKA